MCQTDHQSVSLWADTAKKALNSKKHVIPEENHINDDLNGEEWNLVFNVIHVEYDY